MPNTIMEVTRGTRRDCFRQDDPVCANPGGVVRKPSYVWKLKHREEKNLERAYGQFLAITYQSQQSMVRAFMNGNKEDDNGRRRRK